MRCSRNTMLDTQDETHKARKEIGTMALGEKIRGARKSTGMTQEQLAGILGVSRQAVTKWESGKGLPDIENLRIMAKALNVSIDYLLEDETDLDFSVTREAINLDDYEDKGRWKKKATLSSKLPSLSNGSICAKNDRPNESSSSKRDAVFLSIGFACIFVPSANKSNSPRGFSLGLMN